MWTARLLYGSTTLLVQSHWRYPYQQVHLMYILSSVTRRDTAVSLKSDKTLSTIP